MKKTIKSVKPKASSTFSQKDVDSALNLLSQKEQLQLGSNNMPDIATWVQLRDFLVQRSLVSNPLLTADMTAYTPSETLQLCQKPIIKNWLDTIANFKIPTDAKYVVFVPCAKTKPWKDAKRGIYKSYNKIIKENKHSVYFVTISEPLAIVPQDLWADFPQYDNPGLFRDVVQRSGGLFTKDWKEHFGNRYKMPWDEVAYDQCIDLFSSVIRQFVNNNQMEGRTFLSFVNESKSLSTHADMLNRSNSINPENMFLKRNKSREKPSIIINETLNRLESL